MKRFFNPYFRRRTIKFTFTFYEGQDANFKLESWIHMFSDKNKATSFYLFVFIIVYIYIYIFIIFIF